MHDMIVLDDDPIVRVTLAEALREEGFDVAEAASGPEALALLAEVVGAGVLVTDVQLGGDPTGVSIAVQALAAWPEIRVIYVTGRPDMLDDVPLGTRARLLIKPFMPSYLVAVAQEMIGGR